MSNRRTKDPDADEPSHYAVGHCKPPLHTQFQKGQSGNPRGGSRAQSARRARALALEEAYRLVTVRDGSKVMRLPAIQWPRSEGGRSSPLSWVNRQREEPDNQWKAVAFVRWHEPYESRASRTGSVRDSGRNSPGLLGMSSHPHLWKDSAARMQVLSNPTICYRLCFPSSHWGKFW
jgi:hypothetical protein